MRKPGGFLLESSPPGRTLVFRFKSYHHALPNCSTVQIPGKNGNKKLNPSLPIILIAAALTGCGTLNNHNDPAKLLGKAAPKDSAIVIISAGAPEHCIVSATFLKVIPAGKAFNSMSEVALLSVDGYAVKSDYTSHHGSLHAIVLPAGQYYFAPWVANPYIQQITAKKADFSVAPGEVLYMGEYFMPASCSMQTLSVFRDQRERDLQLLSKRNPELSKENIITRIPTFTGYAVGGPKE